MRNNNTQMMYVIFFSIFLSACGSGGSSSGVEAEVAESGVADTEVAEGEVAESEVAEAEVAEAEEPKADLIVLSIALDPEIPTQGEEVDVTVTIYNQGTSTVYSPFIVSWYGGEHYANVGCLWSVLEGVVAHGGRVLSCTYPGYPSWYPSINTMAKVDIFDSVDESDEENNTELMEITVIE
jgi:galactitol-specific phosphotransferase system IIB component